MDAVVVGSGPNGLAAAIELARAGCSVAVYEAEDTIGGGAKTQELTLPGFRHDVCSAVHPFAVASPFFRSLPLRDFGLEWIESPAAIAHPIGDEVTLIRRSMEETAGAMGPDAAAYRGLFGPIVRDWARIEDAVMGPLGLPRHPLAQARFGVQALRSATGLANGVFRSERARAAFAGIAAHSMLALESPLTAGVGLALGALAHLVGWPIPRGGAQSITNALAGYLESLGGRIERGGRIRSLEELPPARAVLFDLAPKPLLQIMGDRFPATYRRRLERYRYGAAAFKLDWALRERLPWKAPACGEAATVHLGGTMEEIALAERQAVEGVTPERPFVLLSQPTLFDSTRAPEGKHIVWAYCHVPNGSRHDMTQAIEGQIERYAPGFRDLILARSAIGPMELERRNANYVGGDIGAGSVDWRQFFTRPTPSLYSAPVEGIYICSAATPPGVGVHGMCGYHAARRALGRTLRRR